MRYFVPIAALAVTFAAFFVLARGRFAPFGKWQTLLRVVLALPLFVSATGHFVRTQMYAGIVPPIFPHPELLVILTGVFEVAGGVGLILTRTSRAASTCLAILMIAIFPANIYVANHTIAGLPMPGVPARTIMQAVYILLLLISGWGIPGRAAAQENAA